MKKTKYNPPLVDLEFTKALGGVFYSGRDFFHIYTLNRILSLSLLSNYEYRYTKGDETGSYVGVLLNLKEYGEVLFMIDVEESVACIANEISEDCIKNFLIRQGYSDPSIPNHESNINRKAGM